MDEKEKKARSPISVAKQQKLGAAEHISVYDGHQKRFKKPLLYNFFFFVLVFVFYFSFSCSQRLWDYHRQLAAYLHD